jgi:steroid delta-isomerase-like uncharacterized protein
VIPVSYGPGVDDRIRDASDGRVDPFVDTDFKYEVTSRFATGQWAVIEWVMSGTHRGDVPGIPSSGKHFSSVRGSTILELKGGKIRRESDYWDAATFMKRVGLLASH